MMKRFIGVLAFCLLFFMAKADTVGPYEAHFHHRVIETLSYRGITNIHLKADSILPGDTLYIWRAACPGSEPKRNYDVIVGDTNGHTHVMKVSIEHSDQFKIPLGRIVTHRKLYGCSVFTVRFEGTKNKQVYLDEIYLILE